MNSHEVKMGFGNWKLAHKNISNKTMSDFYSWLSARAYGYGDIEQLEFPIYDYLFRIFLTEVDDAILASL